MSKSIIDFETWWEEPITGTEVTKEEAREDVREAMTMCNAEFDLKAAMADAYQSGWNNSASCNEGVVKLEWVAI